MSQHGPGGEHAGQDGPQRAADAVDAEGVERVVVAELALERRAGEEADHAGRQRPSASAGIGCTNPAAGVMQTRPATAPEQAPSTLGLPRVIHSMPAQATAPAAAESGWRQRRWRQIRRQPVHCRR